jgi:integrase
MPETATARLRKKPLPSIGSSAFPSPLQLDMSGQQASITVASFVQSMFVQNYVAKKSASGRAYYQAILKHVLTPTEVARAFPKMADSENTRLKYDSRWPYIGHLKLLETRPADVQRILSSALESGYSTQTVMHIRNVISAIFCYARDCQCHTGANPARMVKLPQVTHNKMPLPAPDQLREILKVMQYPEREMAFVAILTDMNVGEICGLQWMDVNLTGAALTAQDASIPPISIAVRRRLHRGVLADVRGRRKRTLPVSEVLLPILLWLRARPDFTEPDDFVFTTKAGKPVNAMNLNARRLKSIGKVLQIPWLSWQVLRRAHKTLNSEFGRHLKYHMAMAIHHDGCLAPWSGRTR